MAVYDFIPRGWSEFAEWFENFSGSLNLLAAKYGISAEKLAEIEADNEWVQYWIRAKFSAKILEKQLTEYIAAMVKGEIGDPLLTNPSWNLGANPPAVTPPGIKKRIRQIIRQIKAHSAYTEADGELLGIIGMARGRISLNEIQPKLKIETLPDYKLQIRYKKEAMDAIRIETRQKGDSWQLATILTASPGTITVTPLVPDEVEKIEVRAVFQQKNQLAGIYSPTYSPIVQP